MKIPILDFRKWLEAKNLKVRTVDEYIYYCNKFIPYVSLTQENVNKFLSEKGNSNRIARSFLVNLKKFIMVNHRELGINKENLLEIAEVELPFQSGGQKIRLIKPLKQEQVLEIEKHFEGEEDKLKLLMSYYAGLRIGELYKIRIIDFDWEEWKKDVGKIGECRVYGKGDREGIAFFPANLMKRIAAYIRSQNYKSLSSYIFMRKVEDASAIKMVGRMCTWNVHLKKAAIKAGIIQFDDNGKIIKETNVNPHKLRHSWGYHLRSVLKMDIRDIQEILRQASIVSAQRYTYTDKAELKEKLSNNIFYQDH